ncbi:MAG: CpsD/CapB family tyrosine-protein kinase, partial [Firmicutes bacterium]|nr:CpsD/CapB family tyrosine-protein kinase [Candidatus Caballimonas caccae]
GKLEGYNRLRDNILYLNSDGKTKVIQIESSISHEAKTTISCNFAVTLGLADKKVVVVDLDFRKPKVYSVFGISNENGIAEYIMGTSTKEGIIKHTNHKNVDVVTRGAKIYNSTVVLLSEKFQQLIRDLRKEYDYVILDCPPVLLVSDYIHILKVSDGVLFLVAYGITTKNQVTDAINTLKNNNANILGTVFSMYDRKKGFGKSSSYYYKKGYYGYYYNRVSDEKEISDSNKKEE